MPLYVYRCADGHLTEHLVKPSEVDEATYRRECGVVYEQLTEAGQAIRIECIRPTYRQLSAPASSFPGAGSWRAGLGSEKKKGT